MMNSLRHAARMAAGMAPAVLLVKLGTSAVAAVVLLTVLVLGVACWIISSDDRTDRINRMMLARKGDARSLTLMFHVG